MLVGAASFNGGDGSCWLLATSGLLATSYWLLATGYWLLATSYWLLATGY